MHRGEETQPSPDQLYFLILIKQIRDTYPPAI